MSNESDTLYSIKCGISSFIATYIAGVMHPLDLIKTRFQSIRLLIQATMADQMLKIKYPNIKGFLKD